jgi:hypothetical protein
MTTPPPGQELRDLRNAVSQSRDAVESGALVELDGLDGKVARILADACAAPMSARPALVVEIEALLGELDALAAALKRQQGTAPAPPARDAYDAD